MTQLQSIQTHLRAGNSLTVTQCLMLFNCTELRSRVNDLRKMGEDIKSTITPTGNGKRVAVFSMPHAFASGQCVVAMEEHPSGDYPKGALARVVEVNRSTGTMCVRFSSPPDLKGAIRWVSCKRWVRA